MDSRIFFKVNYSVDCALVINIYRCTLSLEIMTPYFKIIIMIILMIIKTIIILIKFIFTMMTNPRL